MYLKEHRLNINDIQSNISQKTRAQYFFFTDFIFSKKYSNLFNFIYAINYMVKFIYYKQLAILRLNLFEL